MTPLKGNFNLFITTVYMLEWVLVDSGLDTLLLVVTIMFLS